MHSFTGGSDGAYPLAGLTKISGTLYGTTQEGGGAGCNPSGCGTVFAVTTSGIESVLHSFAGGSDGAHPDGNLTRVKGSLYGTTNEGGGPGCYGGGCGTVFKITTSGTETVLYNFASTNDGEYPEGSVTNERGTLFGTTYDGGANGHGTVFGVTTAGAETVLYSFAVSEGHNPTAGLTDVDGTLYGATYLGGSNDVGTIYYLSP